VFSGIPNQIDKITNFYVWIYKKAVIDFDISIICNQDTLEGK
jgi:hypothetical protein